MGPFLMPSCFMQEMGLLEVKHGLLQIAETLDFLHSNARLVHRSISPEVFLLSHFLTIYVITSVWVMHCYHAYY